MVILAARLVLLVPTSQIKKLALMLTLLALRVQLGPPPAILALLTKVSAVVVATENMLASEPLFVPHAAREQCRPSWRAQSVLPVPQGHMLPAQASPFVYPVDLDITQA